MIKVSCEFIEEPIKVSHHPAKCGCNKHSCSRRDVSVCVCHVTMQDHVIKALYDFMVRSLSRYITILSNLVAISTVVV